MNFCDPFGVEHILKRPLKVARGKQQLLFDRLRHVQERVHVLNSHHKTCLLVI